MSIIPSWLLELKALLVSLITIIGAIYAFKCWRRPLRITSSYAVFHGPQLDEVRATVTNMSSKTLYLKACRVRGVNTRSYIIKTHLQNPMIKPSLYGNVKYGALVIDMMSGAAVPLEPQQERKFTHTLVFNHSLNYFTNPLFQIEVELTNGKILHSKSKSVPKHWMFMDYHIKNHPK